MKATIYPRDVQGTGAFDGGAIVEQKPIGFPHEQSAVERVGPLFYWAWGEVPQEGAIGLHPHRGFEIMSYVLAGRAEHGDTLGTSSIVGAGGAQVMQTGSGVSHQERIIGPDAEMFQIWFEPHLSQATKREPTYRQHEHEDFPVYEGAGVTVKTVIGQDAPVELVTDVQAWDLQLEPGASHLVALPAGYALAALAVRGGGVWTDDEGAGATAELAAFGPRDFVVLEAGASDGRLRLDAGADAALRMFAIAVPVAVDYPLYRK
ncbi:pirin family protein [Paenibacillus sp. IB182496]|uniref:Pirin family protein n=1 Tax=Paenibacillus sabuli TaxID=2772509 RepID=A0A927BXE9_9BACL|nr:pirin family protein [Paenibacillus sabuli]MBD2848653.1 pirin family protein [Paenibacillus sabuli]